MKFVEAGYNLSDDEIEILNAKLERVKKLCGEVSDYLDNDKRVPLTLILHESGVNELLSEVKELKLLDNMLMECSSLSFDNYQLNCELNQQLKISTDNTEVTGES